MLNIIERLDRARFAPAVAVLKKGGKLDAEVESLGIPFIKAPFTIPAKSYATLLPRAWQVAQVFRPYGFALWHSFHYSEDYTEPLIAYLSGARRWIYTKNNMSWGTRAWKLRSLLASAILCQNSDMLTKFFSHLFYNKKARLLPPGVDTAIFHPNVQPVNNIRSRLGIGRDEIVIVCVADLVPVKGHPALLEAIARVPDVHLLLAGRLSYESYYQQVYRQAEELEIVNRTHFLEIVENIPALLAESDIFVLPTIAKGEGCAIALLEAMACAKACVVTDVPGSHDVIQHGETGLLSKPEDAQSLALALQRLAEDPDLRTRLGQSALQHVRSNYTIEREAESHTRLYENLLESHAS